jgi:hypothetical protein
MLTKSSLAGVRLSELTDQHAQEFARKHSSLSPSGIKSRTEDVASVAQSGISVGKDREAL